MKCNSVYLKPLSFKLCLIPVGAKFEGAYVLVSPGVSKSKEIHRIQVLICYSICFNYNRSSPNFKQFFAHFVRSITRIV